MLTLKVVFVLTKKPSAQVVLNVGMKFFLNVTRTITVLLHIIKPRSFIILRMLKLNILFCRVGLLSCFTCCGVWKNIDWYFTGGTQI